MNSNNMEEVNNKPELDNTHISDIMKRIIDDLAIKKKELLSDDTKERRDVMLMNIGIDEAISIIKKYVS